MTTVSSDAGHVPLLIDHSNEFAPTDNPVTADDPEFGVVGIPVPPISVHIPVPVNGAFPPNVVDEEHKVCSAPAFATLGIASTLMITVSIEDGHVPLLISHWKEFAPIESELTGDDSSDGVVGMPVPLINVQVPFPMSGVFPANVEDEEHNV